MAIDFNPINYQGAWVITMRKIGDIRAFKSKYENSVYNIDMDWLYHINSSNIKNIWEEDKFGKYPRKSIGVHWYAGHPLSQKWNKLLTPDNYINYYNTLTSALKLWRHNINEI